MGTASSKFKKYLQHGDEFAAMQVYQSSGDLKRHLDPNTSYGEHHNHNTPLHYASKHGMKHLLRTFLHDLGGNPNKRNAFNETAAHAACNLEPNKLFSAQERRAACVSLILQWRGADLNNGSRERIDLQAQDQKGDTALHCAAGSGLKRCVELLLSHGSPLFVENHEHLTPCDIAVHAHHHDIAALLESRMVFADSDSNDTVNEAELNGGGEQDEVYSGLRTQDLQEAKDQLLVETSDMLHIPLFTAEALLRDNEWSRETLLDKWMKDPVECCQSAGIQPPPSSSELDSGSFSLTRSLRSPSVIEESNSCDEQESEGHTGSKDLLNKSPAHRNFNASDERATCENDDIECSICMQSVSSWAMLAQGTMSCGHTFCSTCWENYLTLKIQEGDAHHISCPEYACEILVPLELIEKSVTPEVARRYLQFDIKAFVESSRCIKWCPRPGCGQAVRLPETEQTPPPSAAPTSHAVDCGNGHFFCWECLGEVHAPSGCEQWQLWQRKIAEVKPEELPSEGVDIEDAANCLWLVTNSKPCPNCKSPIQKNEGCNHMKCSKCKLDFCWVCLESWKKHSSSTGGYFRCNRFEAVNKADERQGVLISEAMMRNQQATELSRFLHYYTRFRNHENSQKLEEPLLSSAPTKMALLAACLTPNRSSREDNKVEKGTQFVVSGVRELLKARKILCGSYVYGYYLQDNGYNKSIFEFMQNELEEVTEKLSEQIARPYLRTPRSLIIQTTALVRRKRHEFVRAVNKGLVPPETPPILRKNRKRRFPGIIPDILNDKDLSQAIAASLREMDPNDSLTQEILNNHVVHPPDYDSDDEEMSNPAAAPMALCARFGCVRPCARNTRTQSFHMYCSLRCSRAAKGTTSSGGDAYNIDLVIALEMSRLQMIEDELKRHQMQVTSHVSNFPENCEAQAIASRPPAPLPAEAENTASTESTGAHPKQESLDEQTKLAMHLSLQDPNRLNEKLDLIETKIDSNCKGKTEAYNKNTGHMTKDSLQEHSENSHSANGLEYQNEETSQGCNINSPWRKPLTDTSSLMGDFKHEPGEDGRFEIGDIHENGLFNDSATRSSNDDDEFGNYNHFEEDDTSDGRSLKRSHSTGDLVPRRSWRLKRGEPRYHLDSDHSSQHDDKPEEMARRILKAERHTLLLVGLHGSGGSTAGSTAESTAGSTADDTGVDYGMQSSLDEASTVCDTINADLEVCGILNSCKQVRKPGEVRSMRSFANLASIGKKPALDLDLEFIDECSMVASQPSLQAPVLPEENKSLDVRGKEIIWKREPPTSSEAHLSSANFAGPSNSTVMSCNKHFKSPGSKAPGGATGLRIRICESPQLAPSPLPGKTLQETDSSNEYESETGIPKSPTLFISGVSISRTPEPRSPALSVSTAGRQSRSSSLTVPAAPSSPSSIEAELSPNLSPTPCHSPCLTTAPGSPRIRSGTHSNTPSPILSPRPTNNQQQPSAKSKSASEPEREREMFRFPKSSTDGALSSVLHVQESNLSSDDFHEALFLLERSKAVGPNVVAKKRKKSKKERDKDKENSSAGGSSKPLDIIEIRRPLRNSFRNNNLLM